MTSPAGLLSPLPRPREGGLYQRDDDLAPLSATGTGTSTPSSRDAVMDGANAPDQTRLRDGSSARVAPFQASRRCLVLPDPLTFRFLEEDPCVTVVERRCALTGYELYLVEQWTCSRRSPIINVTTYTGDEKHAIVVGVLSIPEDQAHWSARLWLYFNTTKQHNARPKHTELGELMITNLSSFPSALTVIPVPDGDMRKNRQLFILNEDLKRLGCSGRSGLTLADPTEATQAKFHQLYRTSDGIPILQSVTELIKLCQVALYMFDKLGSQYIDGLLCDVTERAIGNWWTEVGTEHYNFEPTDGILGPSTVSALLGMLMGARNRLHWFGAPVPKDVFEIEATKRGVAYFQKQQKLDKTRRFDRQTVFRLHMATAKGASGEGWGVQKAVKSTVTEIGGKRGGIVMDMVSGKGKGGLADIETVDFDRFVTMVYGHHPRWLWHGKAWRTANDEFGGLHGVYGVQDLSSMLLGRNESTGSHNASKRAPALAVDEEPAARRREDGSAGPFSAGHAGSVNNLGDSSGDRDAPRRGVLKSVTGRMSDARSGLGRIKDAVGGNRRGHVSKLSMAAREDSSDAGNPNTATSSTTPNMAMLGRAFTWKNKPDEYLAAVKRGEDVLPGQSAEAQQLGASAQAFLKADCSEKSGDELLAGQESESNSMSRIGSEIRKGISHKGGSSTAHSVADDSDDLRGPLLEKEQKSGSRALAAARRRSCGTADIGLGHVAKNETRWPRRMSFGDAEEAVLTWDEIMDVSHTADYLACMDAHAGAANHLDRLIDEIVTSVGPWAWDKIKSVELLDDRYGRDVTELQGVHDELNEAYQRARYKSDALLGEHRESLTESVKEIEMLVARLDYEIHGLVQKVHDVEEGIRGFERQVDDVERRAAELKGTLETESWPHWLVRTLTGVGTGPNVTRKTS
ncbi:hypothetical protein E4U42_001068 [Claviceps africana]|uniref:STB6-like N-terminal domain-containing protein n=1 Tax=Claviceps africana TaxID=83212 RepID=A0A8K0NJF4_9HYPO|nr:hypothetical protein E4U42_001068 [Claviceps africana]